MPTIPLALCAILIFHQGTNPPVDPLKPQSPVIVYSSQKVEVLVTIDQRDPDAWRSRLTAQPPVPFKAIRSPRIFENVEAVWLEDSPGITLVVETAFLKRQPIFHDLLLAEELQTILANNGSQVLKISLRTNDRMANLIKNSISARHPELEFSGDLDSDGRIWISSRLRGSLNVGEKKLSVDLDSASNEPGSPEPFRSSQITKIVRDRLYAERAKPIVVSRADKTGDLNLIHNAGRTLARLEQRLWNLAGFEGGELLRPSKRSTVEVAMPFKSLEPWKQSILRTSVQTGFKEFGYSTSDEALEALKAGTFKESFSGFSLRFQTDTDRRYLQVPLEISLPVNPSSLKEENGDQQ